MQVAFVGENPGERDEAGVGPNTSLWSCKTDGTALRRLTFNLSNDMDPVVLPDGRMLYAGWLRPPGGARTAWRSSASTRTAPTTRSTPATRACA